MTEELSPAISFATALRDAGVRAQLHCEKKKFKQKLSYADKPVSYTHLDVYKRQPLSLRFPTRPASHFSLPYRGGFMVARGRLQGSPLRVYLTPLY